MGVTHDKLYLMCQRYKFESESQLKKSASYEELSCI